MKMPLLNPSQIHKVLSTSGVSPRAAAGATSPSDLLNLLEKSNLTPEEVLEQLRSLMMIADSDSTRLRAAELALKLNGMLNTGDNGVAMPVVNIIIRDSEYTQINPILIPR